MGDTILWTLGIVVGLGLVGIGFYYQGKVLLKPEESKKTGVQLYRLGIALIAWAFIYIIILIILDLLVFTE